MKVDRKLLIDGMIGSIARRDIMNEQEFIYGKLKYLTESVDVLTNAIEQQQNIIDDLVMIISEMQSPEYARKQVNVAKATDIAAKVAFMRNVMNK